MDIEKLKIDYVRTMEQDIANGIIVVRRKNEIVSTFKEKSLFFKFC